MKWNVSKNLVHFVGFATSTNPLPLVAQVTPTKETPTGGDTNHPQKPTKPNLLTEVQEMKAELVAIWESTGNQHRTTTPDQYRFKNEEGVRPRGCPDCLREGLGDLCTHCFICGRSGHFSYNCRRSQAQNWAYFQGNRLELHWLDRKQPWICRNSPEHV